MARLLEGMRSLDIELTNRCNAQCTFCPRDVTPEQGFITREAFLKTVERACELDTTPKIHSAGQGEPTLHPLLPEFAEHLRGLGIDYGFTTNGALLTEDLSRGVLDAEISHVVFSISDLGEDYEEVYALNFDETRANIFRFLDMNDARGKPARTQVSLVAHDLNRDKLSRYREFWEEAGIDEFVHFEQSNRGGACDHGRYFVDNSRHMEEAAAILSENNISHVCGAPFGLLFVGWNGQYYLCCNDYRKLTPLGSVFDYTIQEMDVIKREQFYLDQPAEACRNCDIDITNCLREVLFEIEAGDSPSSKLEDVTSSLKARQSKLPEFVIARDSA